jgi:general secretion pathway protein D
VSVQEAQEAGRSVQQIMELPKFAIDSTQRLVFIRGPVSKVEPARAIFHDLLHHRPQIYLEVEILNVTRSSSLSYGLDIQNTFPLVPFGDFSSNWKRFIPENFKNFIGFGGGLTFIGVGIANAQIFANATESTRRSIFHAELRTVDGQAATMQIGEKYPIITTTFATGEQQEFAPPPTFQFEDLGLTLKITPRVHGTQEVSLDIEAEYKTLGAGGFNGIPVISNRKIANKVRLSFDEWAIVAGLINSSNSRTLGGLAGAANVPVIGTILSRNTRTREAGETLLVIKPHLINAPPAEFATRGIWTGSETRPRTPL